MFKKLIFFLTLSLLSFSNLYAKNVEDLIGKSIKLTWPDFFCNYTFFPWKEFTSNCTNEEYLKFEIKKFKEGGKKYIDLGSYTQSEDLVSEFMYFNKDNVLVNAYKLKTQGAEWEYTYPKIEINEIDYKDSEMAKKKEYDFLIEIIDLAIYLENSVDDTNEDTIKSHTACKNDLPESMINELGSDPKVIVALKDFPKFSKIVKTKRGLNSFVKFGEKFMEDAMSGVEKDPSEYKVPREFNSIKKNFVFFYGMYMGTIMQCAFADLF
mgnify:CR=1 FL=1